MLANRPSARKAADLQEAMLGSGDPALGEAEAVAHGDAIVPTYYAWIFVLGCMAIMASVVVIAVVAEVIKLPFTFSDRSLAAAYILAVLASVNYLVMHSIVHGLSPAGH